MYACICIYVCSLEHNYVLSSFLNGYYWKNQIQTKFFQIMHTRFNII